MTDPKRIHHGRFKYTLSDEQVREMRRLWKSTKDLDKDDPNKITYRYLMDMFKVGNNTVWKVITYQSYQWVKDEVDEKDESNNQDDHSVT